MISSKRYGFRLFHLRRMKSIKSDRKMFSRKERYTSKKKKKRSTSKCIPKTLICGSLRDLVPFIQFIKCEKHPWRTVTFREVAGWTLLHVTILFRYFSRFSNCTNVNKSLKQSISFIFLLDAVIITRQHLFQTNTRRTNFQKTIKTKRIIYYVLSIFRFLPKILSGRQIRLYKV